MYRVLISVCNDPWDWPKFEWVINDEQRVILQQLSESTWKRTGKRLVTVQILEQII